MSRTSKTLRRLSVPVLVSSVIMTGISSIGLAGVANAAPVSPTNGTLVLTPTPSAYQTVGQTINVDAAYTQASAAGVSQTHGANDQKLLWTVSGAAVFTDTGTNTTTCTVTGGTGNSCNKDVLDLTSQAPVVTVRRDPADVPTDPTIQPETLTLHFAGIHFSNCSQTGINDDSPAAVSPYNYCAIQAQNGQATQQTVTYLEDGVAKAGVNVVIQGGGSNQYPNPQPSPNVQSFALAAAICTTNAQGQCTFAYQDNVNEQFTITAQTTNAVNYPQSSAQELVDVITSATPGRIVDVATTLVKPSTQSGNTPRPGDALEKQFRLFSTCPPPGIVAPAVNCSTGTPLINRTVTLTVDHGFFTRNCSSDGLGGGATYDQCRFDAPAAGADAGNLTSLGTTTQVTTDGGGYFYATLGIKRDAGFDDDGIVDVRISGVATGSATSFPATYSGDGNTGNTCDLDSSDGFTAYQACPSLTTWSTDSRPLNAGTLDLVGIDAHNAVTANPVNVPFGPNTPETREFYAILTDQFGNRTTGSGGPPQILLALSGNTAGSTLSDTTLRGSFTDSTTWDTSIIDANNVGTATVTATFTDNQTRFNTFEAVNGNIPQVATFTTVPADITDVVNFNFYDQLAQAVVTFATTPGNTVTKGTAVTVSATVKDQFGTPIQNMRVTFLVTGPNQSSCNPQNNTAVGLGYTPTNAAGKAGFVFSCNNAGQATVSIVVTDGPSNNELARGVQNVVFTEGTAPPTTGDPSFLLNVGTIQIGQCAVLTVNGTAGHTITIFVKGAGAAGFTALNAMQPGQHMRVCPGTHSEYKVSSDLGASASKKLLVKAIETLVVTRHGQSATFAGHVIPGVVGRRVEVFFYIDGGHVQSAGVGTVKPGGNFSFDHAVNHPGKVVHAFAQTFADTFNTSGRSRLVDTQF